MIVANRKDLDEIRAMLEPYSKVLVVGCGGCVSVCLTGGEEQAEQVATELKLAKKEGGGSWETEFIAHTRQCEAEFCEEIREKVGAADVVLSLACGCGVQLMADIYTPKQMLPGMNTTFMGTNVAKGVWEETCSGCGDCVLAETGGICPITRCSKSLINGTCGGTTDDGQCEVSEKIECAWLLIFKRLKELDRLDLYRKMREPRDWSQQRSGGQRRLTHEHLVENTPEDEKKESA